MFITGRPVIGKDFIDRKKHLPLFKTYIDQNQSFMIKAPRRFGKTSIIKHLLKNKKEYNFIYVDIKRVDSLISLSDSIINKAYKLFKIDNFLYKAKNSMFDLIKTVQKIKIDDIAEITLKFQEKKDNEVEYFLHSLDIVNKIAEKKKINIKFAIDEFQDILQVATSDILDKMRSTIQHHESVTYIFLGSIESIMTKIFEHKTSPFFHFSSIVELPPLDIEELYLYSNQVFRKKGIKVDSLKHLLNFLQGHPDYSLQVLQRIYFTALANDIKYFSNKEVKSVLIDVILSNKAYIEELITKAKQKKHHLEVLYSIANNTKIELDSKSLYNIRVSLENMGLIKRIDVGYYIVNDIFLQIYLQQNSDDIILLEWSELPFG